MCISYDIIHLHKNNKKQKTKLMKKYFLHNTIHEKIFAELLIDHFHQLK